MRSIVHLSDIHFGTADPVIVGHAIEKINELTPDVVVVSGDLTQRARSSEFREAKAFLQRLPSPQIIVPGNHDVPLYNVYDRFFRRLDKFQRYITDDLTPTYVDEELAIVGINSARSLTIKGGRVNDQQVDYIRETMCDLSGETLKIVVSHHPFDLPEGFDEDDIVGRAKSAMPLIAECGANVFLSGHLHVSNIETTAKRYKLDNGKVALIIQAGTATSVRVRGEAHSFNLITFDSPRLVVERLECASARTGFATADQKTYERSGTGWEPIDQT